MSNEVGDLVGSLGCAVAITLAPLFLLVGLLVAADVGVGAGILATATGDCVDDHLSFTNFELSQMLTVPTGNGNLIMRGLQPSVISSGGVA
jgi:hypothetical protein